MKFIDFFSGIGGFRRGMELAGHECVGFCEVDKFATASYVSMHLLSDEQREHLAKMTLKKRKEEILKDEYLNGEWHSSDIKTAHGWELPEADCWCGGFPCFAAGTMVFTSTGYVPIEELKVGDLVLTHKGNWKPILKTMNRDNAELWLMNGDGMQPTITTENHPYYVTKNGDEFLFISVKDLDETYYSTFPTSWIIKDLPNGASVKPSSKGEYGIHGYYCSKLKRPVKLDKRGKVYNISVADDESYIANGAIVHNCQDISIAGHHKGIRKGTRSGLFFQIIRLLEETKEESRPEWILLENVKNILSINKGWDFATVLAEMDEHGYDCEWQMLNSKNFGVPQNRERVFIIGHSRERGPAKVFPIEGTSRTADLVQIGKKGYVVRDNNTRGRVYSSKGAAPTLNQASGGGGTPYIIESPERGYL